MKPAFGRRRHVDDAARLAGVNRMAGNALRAQQHVPKVSLFARRLDELVNGDPCGCDGAAISMTMPDPIQPRAHIASTPIRHRACATRGTRVTNIRAPVAATGWPQWAPVSAGVDLRGIEVEQFDGRDTHRRERLILPEQIDICERRWARIDMSLFGASGQLGCVGANQSTISSPSRRLTRGDVDAEFTRPRGSSADPCRRGGLARGAMSVDGPAGHGRKADGDRRVTGDHATGGARPDVHRRLGRFRPRLPLRRPCVLPAGRRPFAPGTINTPAYGKAADQLEQYWGPKVPFPKRTARMPTGCPRPASSGCISAWPQI